MIENIKSYECHKIEQVNNIDNAFRPALIEFFCKKYGNSHYEYDINKLVYEICS